jgi:thiosulfate/3-mercaptopyruvate sulfurtransferase
MGAVSAPYGLFRGPADNPGQMLDEQLLEERFEALGLQFERPIVIVTDGKTDTDFGAAARVYWTLKSSGFSDLSILNGGVSAWQAKGLELENTPTEPTPSNLEITFSYQWTADTEQVLEAAQGDEKTMLIDARPEEFYQGQAAHPAAAKPGTLPTAKNYVYTNFFEQGSAAITEEIDTAALLKKLGIKDGQDVVSFCNTGHWASTHWFAMSELAGIENAKLYPGSAVEYSNAGYEMANTPGKFKHFLNKLTGG